MDEILNNTYRILQEIASGGMGTVFLAYHLRLQKYVVIKRVPFSRRKHGVSQKEADILKNLHHPCLPQVYDYYETDHAACTVLDYVEGYSLEDYIAQRVCCTEQQLRRWLRQITEALVYLHSQKPPIIHGDVKPGNIIIKPDGNAVLIDFNISLISDYGEITGLSFPYASPEQQELARAESLEQQSGIILDSRTDVYSLAATFYHLMCGNPPSPLSGTPKLSGFGLDYSRRITSLLDQALSRDRGQRPADSSAFLRKVNRLYLVERDCRLVLACRCTALALSGILIACGIFCLSLGHEKTIEQEYGKAISEISTDIENGQITQAAETSISALNNERFYRFFRNNPDMKAQLLAILGDAAFASEEFHEASQWYTQAYETADSVKNEYCTDAIAAAAEAGELDRAQELFDAAQELNPDEQLYIKVVLAACSGSASECASAAEELLQRSQNAKLCALTCISAAEASERYDTALTWLARAETYADEKTERRGIAASYAEIAKKARDEETADCALERAQRCYEALIEAPYPAKADRLNYAVVLRIAGRHSAAREYLEGMLKDYPEDYRVLMQLAFCCDELSSTGCAEDYCLLAVAAWKNDLSPEREEENSENIHNLLAMAERYEG